MNHKNTVLYASFKYSMQGIQQQQKLPPLPPPPPPPPPLAPQTGPLPWPGSPPAQTEGYSSDTQNQSSINSQSAFRIAWHRKQIGKGYFPIQSILVYQIIYMDILFLLIGRRRKNVNEKEPTSLDNLPTIYWWKIF